MTSTEDLWANRRPLSSSQFAQRVRRDVQNNQGKYAFLLGAGASVSSGIPTAGALAEDWLCTLYSESTNVDRSADSKTLLDSAVPWANETYGWNLTRDQVGSAYSRIIEELFGSRAARQREFHRICKGRQPHVSYTALALLVGGENNPSVERPDDGLNVVLTTNFDDLLATSLYRWAARRPRVISHWGLADFAADDFGDPLVLHLHGAYQTALDNTETELTRLIPQLEQPARELLARRELIVIGYSGRDPDIAALLLSAYGESQHGIHWVSADRPTIEGSLYDALKAQRNSTWISAPNADTFLSELADEFEVDVSPQGTLQNETARAQSQWSHFVKRTLESTSKRQANPDGSRAQWSNPTQALTAATIESNPEVASRLWDAAVEQFPGNTWIRLSYAIFKAKAGEDEAADRLFREAVELSPENAGVVGNYAVFKSHRGDEDEARRLYSRALQLDPQASENLKNYALFEVNAGNIETADSLFESALLQRPTDSSLLANFAAVKDALGDIRAARALYERALRVDSHNSDVLNAFARHCETYGDPDEARRLFKRAIKLSPDDADNVWTYGVFLSNVGELDEASEVLENAIAMDPDNAQGRVMLADLRRLQGDRESAAELLDQATSGPDRQRLLGSAAMVAYELGQDEQAEAWLREGIESDDSDLNLPGNLIGILIAQDRVDDAKELLERHFREFTAPMVLRTELDFYRWAMTTDRERIGVRKRVTNALAMGVRSPGFGLPGQVAEWASNHSHPDADLLAESAASLTGVPQPPPS